MVGSEDVVANQFGIEHLRALCKFSFSKYMAFSTLFVQDESHVNLLQALITGPEDTPYANGCFFFDICFPLSYPAKPPHVSLRTTGGGKVRFNPNLYK